MKNVNPLALRLTSRGTNYENLAFRFKELATRLAELCRLANAPIAPYNSDKIPFFNALSCESKKSVIYSLEEYIAISSITLMNGKNIDDTKSLSWHGLKYLGFRFKSDMLEKIEDGDVIEVYTNDHIQVFRNFKFFQLISYSIEDIFCRPWTELFTRDNPENGSAVLDIVKKFSTRELDTTVSISHLGRHIVREAISPLKYEYDYLLKYLSPLYDTNMQPVGYIMIEQASVTNHLISPSNDRKLLTDEIKKLIGLN